MYIRLSEHVQDCLDTFSLDTGRKSNVHKTFRTRSRHLLKVLCTVNLRPVSPRGVMYGIKYMKINQKKILT